LEGTTVGYSANKLLKEVDRRLCQDALEKEKHKVDDAVTVDKKHSNDIQRSEEEDYKQLQSTAFFMMR
jgi:hypothetical protein